MNHDLLNLNSITKYPSIPTYHKVSGRHILDDNAETQLGHDIYHITEKLDGINIRIIVKPGEDFFIGTRQELVYANGDRIYNDRLGIIKTVKHIGHQLMQLDKSAFEDNTCYVVVYGELIGGKVHKNSKQYTKDKETLSFMAFDMAMLDDEYLYESDLQLDLGPDARSAFREANYRKRCFVQQHVMMDACYQLGIGVVPNKGTVLKDNMPSTVAESKKWLIDRTKFGTMALLDGTGEGNAEGLIISDPRNQEAFKLRVQDYRRNILCEQ